MMKWLQRLGRSLMLPVAVLPAAALLTGIGYAIDPTGWGAGSAIGSFMISAGNALLSNIPVLFAVGVALGMSKERDGSAALSGLVAYLVITKVLGPENVANLQGIEMDAVNPAFANIGNAFIGIISGIVASLCYNRFHNVRLPDWLAFFSGRRSVPIMTALSMLAVSLVFLFIWPAAYSGLVAFGTAISDLGVFGAGLYGFFNRLLIPTGLHHALNSVFWFDTIGINDIGKFWASEGVKGVTGMYQAGFFPIMMFGLPGAALAMYHTAKPGSRKKAVGSLLFAAAFASFVTGVTEPIEFVFMFLAPALYVLHALLTGLSLMIASIFQWTAGFGFSAGVIDFVLSLSVPIANKPYMLLVQGLVFFVIYYVLFRYLIVKFDLKTPGRGEEEEEAPVSSSVTEKGNEFRGMATEIVSGLGGRDNIENIDFCATRLRVEVKNMEQVDEEKIKKTGVPGTHIVGKNSIQVIVGTNVQFVYDEVRKLLNK